MSPIQLTYCLVTLIGLQIISNVNGIPQNYLRDAVKRLNSLKSLPKYDNSAAVPGDDMNLQEGGATSDQNNALYSKRGNRWTAFTRMYGKRSGDYLPNMLKRQKQSDWTSLRIWGKRQAETPTKYGLLSDDEMAYMLRQLLEAIITGNGGRTANRDLLRRLEDLNATNRDNDEKTYVPYK